MADRVVITGMGIYSCIGKNKNEVVHSLYEGRSGIGLAPERKEMGYRSSLCGILEKPDLKGLLDRRQRLCLSEHGQYAYVATVEALEQAGIDKDYLLNNEVGILYGNDSSAEAVISGVDVIREKKNTVLVGSGNIFQSMNSTVTMNLSTIFNLRGINFTIAGVMPNLFVIFILFIGLFYGRTAGVVYGLVVGMILDLVIGKQIGVNMIGFGIIGFLAALFDRNFSKDSRATIMFMVLGATIIFEMIVYVADGVLYASNIEVFNFIKILAIEIIYNLILTIIIYPLIQKFGYYIENEYKENKILTRYF